jgi:hypothetical protein
MAKPLCQRPTVGGGFRLVKKSKDRLPRVYGPTPWRAHCWFDADAAATSTITTFCAGRALGMTRFLSNFYSRCAPVKLPQQMSRCVVRPTQPREHNACRTDNETKPVHSTHQACARIESLLTPIYVADPRHRVVISSMRSSPVQPILLAWPQPPGSAPRCSNDMLLCEPV